MIISAEAVFQWKADGILNAEADLVEQVFRNLLPLVIAVDLSPWMAAQGGLLLQRFAWRKD